MEWQTSRELVLWQKSCRWPENLCFGLLAEHLSSPGFGLSPENLSLARAHLFGQKTSRRHICARLRVVLICVTYLVCGRTYLVFLGQAWQDVFFQLMPTLVFVEATIYHIDEANEQAPALTRNRPPGACETGDACSSAAQGTGGAEWLTGERQETAQRLYTGNRLYTGLHCPRRTQKQDRGQKNA